MSSTTHVPKAKHSREYGKKQQTKPDPQNRTYLTFKTFSDVIPKNVLYCHKFKKKKQTNLLRI